MSPPNADWQNSSAAREARRNLRVEVGADGSGLFRHSPTCLSGRHRLSTRSLRSVRHAALSDGLLISPSTTVRAVSLDTSGDAWVFPSENLTTPLAKDNCWRRGCLLKLKSVGWAWGDFQVIRRTHSSPLQELDVDPHVRAEQMGHPVDVNEYVYTIT